MPNILLKLAKRAAPVALALAAGAALADPPAAYGARRSEAITFHDWRLHCRGDDCDLRSLVRAGDGTLLLVAEIGPDALRFATPLPLFLPDGITLALGSDPLRAIPWRTCDAQGCDAVADLDPSLRESLKRERQAEITFTLLEGLRVRLPVSLSGVTAGIRAREALTSP